MNLSNTLSRAGLAAAYLVASLAYGGDAPKATVAAPAATLNAQKLADITPGITTKTQVRTLLGTPWRIVQFNDCGMAMPGQADETWEYRGHDSNGSYRLHVEFDEHNVAHLVARIPDSSPGGKGTAAKIAPMVMAHNESM